MAPAYPERQPPYLKLTRTFAGSDALEEELRVLLAADLLGLEAAALARPQQQRLGVVEPQDPVRGRERRDLGGRRARQVAPEYPRSFRLRQLV
jgi:hypothetical protein